MKIVVLLISGILLVGYLLEYSNDPVKSVFTSTSGQVETPEKRVEISVTGSGDIDKKTSDDVRREEIAKAFAMLKELRAGLKSTANLLKSRIWGLKLPPAQAKDFSNKMTQAYVYLKNPPQLGAYYDVTEIERESRKVNGMLLDLKQLDIDIAIIKAEAKNET